MSILWILVQVISPIFGFIYGLALSPWRFSKRTTLIASSVLITALTVVNILVIKYYYPMVDLIPKFDIIYRIGNVVFVAVIAILFIAHQKDDKTWIVRILFGLLSVCACIFVVDTVAITIRTLLSRYQFELFYELLLYPLMLIVVIKIRKPFLDVSRYMDNHLWPLCFAPLVLVFTILMQISIIAPLEQNPENIPVALCLCVITVVVYGIIFYLFRTLHIQSALKNNTEAFHIYTASLEQQNELISKNAQKAALFRHDIRHISRMMSACAESGDMNGIKKLIKHLDKNTGSNIWLAVNPITGHKPLDTVLNNYISHAREWDINISINITDIELISVDLTELAVVLANALENAVHACKKQQEDEKHSINMEGRKKGKQYFLEIANTFSGEIRFDNNIGLPISNEKGHGTGVKSIAYFVKKSGGELLYKTEGNWLHMMMLLPVGNKYLELTRIIDNKNKIKGVARNLEMMIDISRLPEEKADLEHFECGRVIIREGETECGKMYILIEGTVDVYKNYREPGEVKIAKLTQGDFFGEMSLFLNRKRTATVVATTDVTVFALDHTNAQDFFQENIEAAFTLIQTLCARLANTNTDIVDNHVKYEKNILSLIQEKAELEAAANIDLLTGVYNRRHFMAAAEMHIKEAQKYEGNSFVGIMDLDHFKIVNDNFGHLAGDKVLKSVAERVNCRMRSHDLFARYGGEEFVLLVTKINEKNAYDLIESIRQSIKNEPIEFEGKQLFVSASFGIAAILPGTDLDTAISFADKALYMAKNEGRDRTVFYKQETLPERR